MSRAAISLRYALEQKLERGRSANPDAPLYIRASGIGDCARKQTYSAQGFQQTPMSAASGLMAVQGNWMEDGVVNYLIEPGEAFNIFDSQRELTHYNDEGELVLKGHIDGLLQENLGDVPSPTYLWEMKGMSAFRYHKLLTTPGGVEKSNYGYYVQVQTYMTLLNNEGTDVPSCLFTVMAKDPSAANTVRRGSPPLNPIYIEEIPWDEEIGEFLLSRAERLYGLVTQGQLGDRERSPYTDWDCSERFCPYYAECDPKSHAMSKVQPGSRGGVRVRKAA
jgi:hypothetical protein